MLQRYCIHIIASFSQIRLLLYQIPTENTSPAAEAKNACPPRIQKKFFLQKTCTFLPRFSLLKKHILYFLELLHNFIHLHLSKSPKKKVDNCQILRYIIAIFYKGGPYA